MRERGYTHATLAHSTINSAAVAIGHLLYRAFPQKFPPTSEPISDLKKP